MVSYPASTTTFLGPKCTVNTLPYILESCQGEWIDMFIQSHICTQTLVLATLGGFWTKRSLPALPDVSRCCCIQVLSNSYRLAASLLAPCLHNKVSAIAAPIRAVNKVPLHSCGVLQKQASNTTLGGCLENAVAGRPVYCSAGDLRQAGVHTPLRLKPQTLQKQSQTITLSFRAALVSNYGKVGSVAVITELFAVHQKLESY